MTTTYTTAEELASYGIGRQVGEQLTAQPFPGMNTDALLVGFTSMLKGEKSLYTEDQIRAAMNEIQERMNRMQKQQANSMAATGEQFLRQNAQRAEVSVTDSGLQYEVLTQGSGKKPTAASTVRVHYHGTLTDGTVFDSSVQRGEPLEFPLNGVIAGWTEGLQLMPEGSKYRLFIPHELGYGARGAGGAIAPYSTLIFDVELLSIL
jgi:FKBP-type peptidyl-prolyl cis-trans isomerase FklB